MFDIDRWNEIFQTIRKNKLRTFLSGFTITFAILLFTILLAMGNGLKNSFTSAFRDNAENAIYIFPGVTSRSYQGLPIGREVQMETKDFNYIVQSYKNQIQYATAVVNKNVQATFGRETSSYSLRAVHPQEQFIEIVHIINGRYINDLDIKNHTKVIVIGNLVRDDLFPKGVNPIGKYINLDNIMYKVVGVYNSDGGDRDKRIIYMPITTAQKLYGNNQDIDRINLTYNLNMTFNQAIDFGTELGSKLRERLKVAPNDQSAIFVQNFAEDAKASNQVYATLVFVVIFIGSGTLIAGIVGISNIMVYIVKERTKEFGIRKALGATPRSIIGMVLFEAFFITAIAGYIGLVLGMFIINWMRKPLEEYFIKNPSVDNTTIFAATIVLIIAGVFAGYLPARKAAKIKPIVALRHD
ncbi:ABC transporter permease [Aureivirga marina]|uniref:ABC transporter permease n=1 Tax=Aureivirga marina TaxID=1182451 RepID=UPI0018C9A9F8|nr:ABC transporter permease [Aureivirga marina]